MQTTHLFVYGSLLSGFQNQAYDYIKKYFQLLGAATVNGTMYDMGAFPVAVPKDTGRRIIGELYEICKPLELSFALAQLDDYEGLYPEENEPVYYERQAVDVNFGDQVITAWVYWYIKDVEDRPIVESGSMLEYAQSRQ